MNNFEWIKDHNDSDSLGKDLCDYTEEKLGECERCPFYDSCEWGYNGFKKWLKEEHK